MRERVVGSDEAESAEDPAADQGAEPAGHEITGQPEVA